MTKAWLGLAWRWSLCAALSAGCVDAGRRPPEATVSDSADGAQPDSDAAVSEVSPELDVDGLGDPQEAVADGVAEDAPEPRDALDSSDVGDDGGSAELDGGGSDGQAAQCAPPCQNGGECVAAGVCDCAATGYEGTSCEVPACTGGCLNGGVCIYPESCRCDAPGYTGQRCETPVCAATCVNGTCVAPETCECDDLWQGARCDEPVCEGGCLNGGSCAAPGTCDCSGLDFDGPRCELVRCGLAVCPTLEGYAATCSAVTRCVYEPVASEDAWRADEAWIFIRASLFPLGAPDTEVGSSQSERPQTTISFAKGFLIGRHEVTVRTYEACVSAGRCTPAALNETAGGDTWGLSTSAKQRARHPQNGLTWHQAKDVCAFLGGRLPSEAEWEYAATGGSSHRLYPWGNSPAPICGSHAIFDVGGSGCGTGGTAEVGATLREAGRSGAGLHDMAGNVWEWIEDCWHSSYVGVPTNGSAWTTGCASAWRVLRGGSYYNPDLAMLRTSNRSSAPPTSANALTGVRCAREAPSPPPTAPR